MRFAVPRGGLQTCARARQPPARERGSRAPVRKAGPEGSGFITQFLEAVGAVVSGGKTCVIFK